MWRAGFGLVVAVACASCLDVPPHRTTDGGPADARQDGGPDGGPSTLEGVTVLGEKSIEPVTVSVGTRWKVRFPSPRAAGARLPDLIEIGGTDVLGHDAACEGEDGVGLAIYPAATISAQLPGADTSSIDVLPGAAFTQVIVMWTASFNCPAGTPVNASGFTGFSFYPDGRVVRIDNISPADTDLTDPSPCGCSSAGDFYVTSYLALANAQFNRIRWHDTQGDREDTMLPLNATVDDSNPTWACMDNFDGSTATRRVGVLWEEPALGLDDLATRLRPDSPNTVLLWDWQNSDTEVTGNPTYSTVTTWYLSDGPPTCEYAELDMKSVAFKTPAAMMFDDGLVAPFALDIDFNRGLYFYDPSPRPPTLPTMYTLTPVAAILPGFAVSVLFETDQKPTLRRNGLLLASSYDYLEQIDVVETGQVWRHTFWFPANFVPGATITITAP